ncbi:restriction endonuclease subunit S [uncultured Methanobrevibacter sp.]|uniref:restriction endonuclease subunit S n=3 Tax=Methanobrevibacter smithii TaxID=2173 RepID=UPI0025E78ABA|nr:restriction endonuclease subunit S [uncultured Methanobrevibacter sp.]
MSLEKIKTVTLADVSINNKGEYGIGASAVDYSDELYTYLRITDINDDGTLNKNDLKSVDDVDAKNYLLNENDVVFARTGNSTGKAYYYDKMDGELVYAGFLIKFSLDPSKINPKFMKYYVLSKDYKGWVNSMCTGSTRPNINAKMYGNMELILPPREQQDFLVNILGEIDNKIEINKRINKNLEQLMKCIFEDWFVNFNYSNDISFKSSELGEIPSNWNVKKLRDVLIVLESGKRPKGGISNIDDGIPSIGAENILGLGKFNYSKNKLISHEFFSTLKKGVIQDKDVLLYKDGAQLGRKSLFMKGFPFDICCINEHVFRLQSNDEINQFYLYLWLDQEVMTNEIINLNSNSAQPGINQNDVKSLPILVPELKIISKFNKIISPMMNQIFDNALKINKLTNLRDTLLPKLMSGEIDVSKINCDLELKYNYMKYLFNQIHTPMSKSVV